VIKTKVEEKGFGFITNSEGGKDVFFHASNCGGDYDSLAEGDHVTFDVEQGDKGPRGINVQRD
jgi:CspA family cold shock protein